ncbi:MAG: flap endonuclease-1 [Candidatus Thermoplasmatota archaeon]|nr:flap endonuclease-1 [Candidatus Thermoplasmatota archaeon]MCL5730761.1 flap endonuclease-1 [Candidatus Thermoplasmatota archaeon]
MGVDLSPLVVKEKVSIRDFSGMTFAIDGYNILYQFLSSIRQNDGTPLMDSKGRVTSHLSGCFYRSISLMEAGIRPVFVFDGKPSRLKAATIRERVQAKEKAAEELIVAREKRDMERVRSLSARVNYITRDMVGETKALLSAMGIPYVQAPSEGEAQASYMCRTGQVYGVVSQDYDCLLFGSKRVFRNFTSGGRRKIPGKNMYVPVSPEMIDLDRTLEANGITYDQLVDMAIMIGTDFNTGIEKVGPKTALKLIKQHGSIESVLSSRGEVIENLDEIKAIFKTPSVEEKPEIKFRAPDRDKIIQILCDEHQFASERIDPFIETLISTYGGRSQTSLDTF